MKFLHLADLHIGKVVNGFNLIEDQRHVLEELLAISRDSHVDAIVIAGDVYEKQNPSAEAVELVDWLLTEIASAQIECMIVPGNHDSAERMGFGSHIFARNGIHIARRFDGHVERVTLADGDGPVTFWLLPFIRAFEVRHHFPDAQIGTDVSCALKTVFEADPPDSAMRNVLVAHQFVSFASFKPELSESEVTVGGLDEVDGAIFSDFDYVALGHIHKSQAVGSAFMRYAGSLLKYSFSEARDNKQFPLVTLGRKGDVDITTVSCTPLHDMREISGPFERLISPEVVASEPADDYLHVTLTDPHPILDALQKMRLHYPNVMSLDYRSDIERANREHPELTAAQSRENAFELFERFFEKQYGQPLTTLQRTKAQEALEHAFREELR